MSMEEKKIPKMALPLILGVFITIAYILSSKRKWECKWKKLYHNCCLFVYFARYNTKVASPNNF